MKLDEDTIEQISSTIEKLKLSSGDQIDKGALIDELKKANDERKIINMCKVGKTSNQTIIVTPSKIVILSGEGIIILDDEHGILIDGIKVQFTAERNLRISSNAKVVINATEKLKFSADDSSLCLKEKEIVKEGKKINMVCGSPQEK